MSQKVNKNYRMAIIDSGFMGEYLHFFINLCNKHNIKIDLITKNKAKTLKNINKHLHIKSKFDFKHPLKIIEFDKEIKEISKNENYDYILSDTFALSNTVSVFHTPTITKRMQIAPNCIYKLIHFCCHANRIIFNKFFYRNCSKIFVVSSLLADDYHQNCNIPKNRIKIIYPGYQFIPAEKNYSAKNKENFIVGMSANGFATKGGFILLDAVRILKKKYPKIKAKIICTRYQKNIGIKLFVNLFKLQNNVEFLGYQKNMENFYNSLDCMVCPSLFEAFGRVVTEAMLFKVPTIVSSTTGAKDIITDSKNGFIFNRIQYSGKNLADKIEYVMKNQDKMPELTEKAYATAKNITWEKFANDMFFELYPEFSRSGEPDLKPSMQYS